MNLKKCGNSPRFAIFRALLKEDDCSIFHFSKSLASGEKWSVIKPGKLSH